MPSTVLNFDKRWLIRFLLTPFFAFLWGACVGSFLNVCLFRWKKGFGIVSPASFCPSCGHFIRWFDNIPLVSFAVLKGKCRDCGAPISSQYPAIEISTGILFWMAARPGARPLAVIASFAFVSFLVLLVASDLKWRLLPHPFNNLFALCGFFPSLFLRPWPLDPFQAVSSMVILGAFSVLLGRFFPEGLGGGDINMIAAMGLWFGVTKTLFALVLAFGMGALVGLRLIWAGQATRKSLMPFGPFLALGALLVWYFPMEFNS